jgi:hypothetical protein
VSLFLLLATAAFSGTTYSHLEDRSGWQGCSDCAGAGGNAKYSYQQHQSSPSTDGSSIKFNLGGSTPWSHALFHNRVSGGISSQTNFILDFYYYLKTPAASSGLEIAANQAFSGRRYKWSHQCSYVSGVWKTWDATHKKWVNTSIPCRRPSAYSWHHVTFEMKRSGGKTVFVSLTQDGHKYYINRSYSPESFSDNGTSVRFQLNGNAQETDYSGWVDKMTFKAY